jgi:hypothetical protein
VATGFLRRAGSATKERIKAARMDGEVETTPAPPRLLAATPLAGSSKTHACSKITASAANSTNVWKSINVPKVIIGSHLAGESPPLEISRP